MKVDLSAKDPAWKLPVNYAKLQGHQRALVREQYVEEQKGLCWHCKESLYGDPPTSITERYINWGIFPPNFLEHPIHLQHNHGTGLTEGAVHAYCNAVMWQYHGR